MIRILFHNVYNFFRLFMGTSFFQHLNEVTMYFSLPLYLPPLCHLLFPCIKLWIVISLGQVSTEHKLLSLKIYIHYTKELYKITIGWIPWCLFLRRKQALISVTSPPPSVTPSQLIPEYLRILRSSKVATGKGETDVV